MARIYLFKSETYTNKIEECRRELLELPQEVLEELIRSEFISSYISSAMWNENSAYGRYHKKVMKTLKDTDIVCFHNTRLMNPDLIRDKGLIFADERYVNNVLKDARAVIKSEATINELCNNLKKEIDRWDEMGSNRRKKQVCFFFDIDYYEDYDSFLVIYGGEFMESVCLGKWAKENMNTLKPLFKLGKPYVVEFLIPYERMSFSHQQDVARYLIEEWVHIDLRKDAPQHKYNSWEEFEIPPEWIIDVHEVLDQFDNLNAWYFEER